MLVTWQQDNYAQLEGSSKQLHIPVDHCPSGNCEGGGAALGFSVLEDIAVSRRNKYLKVVDGYGGAASHL